MEAYFQELLSQPADRGWPRGMTDAEKKEPHASFEHYRPFFMMWMATHWLPQQTSTGARICKGSSQFALKAKLKSSGQVELTPPVSIFDSVYEGCADLFLLPTLTLREEGSTYSVALSLVVNPDEKLIEFSFAGLRGHNKKKWMKPLSAALQTYFKQSALLGDYTVLKIHTYELKFVGAGLHGSYHLLHDVLKMLQPETDIHHTLERQGKRLRPILDAFIKQAWVAVANVGLLKKGAPFSLAKTASYEAELEQLSHQIEEDNYARKKRRLRAQYWKLVEQRQKLQDWALGLVAKGSPSVEKIPDSAWSVLPQPGEPAQPISPLRSPVEFLNQLLANAKAGCQWPANMSAEDRADPYQAFMFYRPYYLRYMLQTELPQLGYLSGCSLPEEPVTVTILFADTRQYRLLSVWSHPDLDTSIMKLLQQTKKCSVIVLRLQWLLPDPNKPGHEMSLVVDVDRKTVEYMEPNGTEETEWIDPVVDALADFLQKSHFLSSFKLVPPFQACPARIQFDLGYCAHYSIMYDWLRVACSHCETNAVSDGFSQYDRESKDMIIEAFTCHMWQKVASIGLLDQFRDQSYPLSKKQFLDRTGRFSLPSGEELERKQEYDTALQQWANKKVDKHRWKG